MARIPDIRVGVRGTVISGQGARRFVMIEDDRDGPTKGLYVLWCDVPDFSGEVFDDWVENWDTLLRYFRETALVVAWE